MFLIHYTQNNIPSGLFGRACRPGRNSSRGKSRKKFIPEGFCPMTDKRILLLLLAAFLLVPAWADAMSGREIFEKMHEVRLRMLNQKTEATMVLYDRGGGKRIRTLTQYSKNAAPEAYKVLLIFNSPADLKNVGFLAHARTFSDRSLWAYFPEFKRIRRIPTSAQDDSFFGSDFSYDDFSGPPNLDDYAFKVLREETVDDRPCYVVEVSPKIPRKYSKYITWVVKNLWITAKVEFYREKELYRLGAFRDIRLVDGLPTPFTLEMQNVKSGHRTVVTVNKVSYRTSFPDELFTQRALERGGR
jgi:outer membrane lipoprotein-sorting protein